MDGNINKALAGLNGGNAAAIVFVIVYFVMPMQERLDTLSQDAQAHALRCYVDRKHFEGLAADKLTAADNALSVYQRYRTMSEFQELTPVNRNRMIEKQEEEQRFRAEAEAFTRSANLVCQIQ